VENFKVGDIVQLLSGGPKMTVHRIERDSIQCHWFAGSKLESGWFAPQTLKAVGLEEPKKP